MNNVAIGAVYRHYKQKLYRVLTVAICESTHEPLVVYEAQYQSDVAQVWARPVRDFLDVVQTPEYTGPRFTREPST